MEEKGHGAYVPETSGYAPANPTSIPPKYLAWTALGIGAIVLVGYLIWRTLILGPDLPEVSAPGETVASVEERYGNLYRCETTRCRFYTFRLKEPWF